MSRLPVWPVYHFGHVLSQHCCFMEVVDRFIDSRTLGDTSRSRARRRRRSSGPGRRPRRVGWQGIWRPARLRLRLHIHFQQSQKGGLRCDRSLSTVLYGCETWSLTEELYRRLRCMHAHHLRAMCQVSRSQAWEHHISTQELGQRLGLDSHRVLHRSPIDVRCSGLVSSCPMHRGYQRAGGNACSLRISLFVGGRHGGTVPIFLVRASPVPNLETKKENERKRGMGGRHAAKTRVNSFCREQGERTLCAS